jgi:hypothetical protein
MCTRQLNPTDSMSDCPCSQFAVRFQKLYALGSPVHVQLTTAAVFTVAAAMDPPGEHTAIM